PTYLGAFLAKITRCLSIDRCRLKYAQKRGSGELVKELTECVVSPEDTEIAFEKGCLRETLDKFLYSLSKEKRTVFMMRYFFSMPIADISDKTGMSSGQIKMMLSRTRKSLGEFLAKEGVM
ncbi:MAG TPA: RNA polymerase sigma factor, partial [Bacillota bacterium]|nr:RNA polymerase sigma factor [Bacillota bacterium]